MAMSSDGSFAVVGCRDTDAVALLRPPWDSVTATLLLADNSHCLGVTPDGQSVLVGQTGSHSILVVDLPGLMIVDTIQLSDAPIDMAVSPDGSRAYATLSTGVAVVDLASCQQTGTIVTDIAGGLVRVTPDGGSLLLSSRADSGFCVIDVSSGQVLRTVNLHQIVIYDLQATPDGGYHVATDVKGAKYVSAATGIVVDSLVPAAGAHIAFADGGNSLFLAGGRHFYMFVR
jgi:DNA-binding beta-propeller fold protein YncE